MEPHTIHDRKDDVFLLDVREPQEWQDGRIPGAVHIPMGDVPDRLDEIDRDRPVITYCASGRRSGEVAQYLQGAGFDATNMAGGIQRWESEGLPVETS